MLITSFNIRNTLPVLMMLHDIEHTLVEDEFVKVVRVGTIYRELESDDEELSTFDLNQDFTTQILSGVMFAPLQVQTTAVPTVIPATVWSPTIQQGYPLEFKQASRQLFLCSNSQLIQPPPVIVYEERINAAALLPNSVWVNILSFTHRKCKTVLYFMFVHKPAYDQPHYLFPFDLPHQGLNQK
jgi:hypothetical protein